MNGTRTFVSDHHFVELLDERLDGVGRVLEFVLVLAQFLAELGRIRQRFGELQRR